MRYTTGHPAYDALMQQPTASRTPRETPTQRRLREENERRWAAQQAERDAATAEAQREQEAKDAARRQHLADLVAADAQRLRDAEDAARQRDAAAFEADVKQRYLATGATEQDWQRDRDACLQQARIDIASGRRPAPLTRRERDRQALLAAYAHRPAAPAPDEVPAHRPQRVRP
jgi:hypothetical protein